MHSNISVKITRKENGDIEIEGTIMYPADINISEEYIQSIFQREFKAAIERGCKSLPYFRGDKIVSRF